MNSTPIEAVSSNVFRKPAVNRASDAWKMNGQSFCGKRSKGDLRCKVAAKPEAGLLAPLRIGGTTP
jgi:hypothetical protein